MNEPPKCPVCGKHTPYQNFVDGYSTCCSHECMYKYEGRMNKIKSTMLERYGVENSSYCEETKRKRKETSIKHYVVECPLQSPKVREKSKNTCLKRYGVEYVSQSEEVKNKIKETNKIRYGVEYSLQSPEVRERGIQTCLKRYGVNHFNKSEEFKKSIVKKSKKIYDTKMKNHTWNSSKIEQSFKQWLDDNNITYKYQYTDDKYPFNCDFYFPDKDLYLEIQGNWTHGNHPYNQNDKNDQKELQKMIDKGTKYYNGAIKIWTERDPLKRQTAKKNNLNWVEVFTTDLDELINIFDSKYKN